MSHTFNATICENLDDKMLLMDQINQQNRNQARKRSKKIIKESTKVVNNIVLSSTEDEGPYATNGDESAEFNLQHEIETTSDSECDSNYRKQKTKLKAVVKQKSKKR